MPTTTTVTQYNQAPEELANVIVDKLIHMVKPKGLIYIPDDVELTKEAAAKIFSNHYNDPEITIRSARLIRLKTIKGKMTHMTMKDIRFYIENNVKFI